MREQVQVAILNSSFFPSYVRVPRGTTVSWVNHDTALHTVTARAAGTRATSFDSGLFGLNAVYAFTFAEAGRFEYFCNPHPTMTGMVEVE